MINVKKTIALLFSLFVLFELSLLFGEFDLEIWVNFGNPESAFGLLMEVLGESIAPMLFSLSGLVLFTYYQAQPDYEAHKKAKAALGIVFSFAGIIYCTYRISSLSFLACVIFFAACCGLFIGLAFLLRKMSPQKLFQLYCIAITTVFYCILVLIIINIFKVLWGRVRPRELTDYSQFSKFYIPQGINGYRSFPSGHTANATVLFVITMFAPICKNKFGKALLYIIPILWIIVMATSRVLFGAHYASDVLYGAAFSIIIFYISKYLAVRYIAKTLSSE